MIPFVLTALAEPPAANGQLFRPSIDATHTLWTDDSQRAPDGYVLARGIAHYANRPVVFIDADGVLNPYVSDVLQLSALVAWSAGPVRVGLDVPVLLRSMGALGGESGLGDLGVEGKLSLLDGTRAPLGLALVARMSFPTTTVAAPLGSRGLGWEVSAVVDRRFGPLLVAMNVGTRGVPNAALDNFEWSDQFQARAGLGYALGEGGGLSLDVGSNVNYANLVPGSTPAEALVGGWARLGRALVFRGGVGTGITGGYGASRLRVVSGLAWEPPRAPDEDGDGVPDRHDRCVHAAEDPDGFEDEDGCPEATPVRVRLLDTEGDAVEGRWTLSGEMDVHGVSGSAAAVPAGRYRVEAFANQHADAARDVVVPEGGPFEIDVTLADASSRLAVRITDEFGIVIPGAEWSVVGKEDAPPSLFDPLELEPGALSVRAVAEGFSPATQILSLEAGERGQLVFALSKLRPDVEEQIWVNDSVFFETGRATLRDASTDVLDELAALLLDHPELARMRIEGHTDSRGSKSYNLELSSARAASVLDYLVSQGVAPERLDSVGFGESRPLVEGDDEAAWGRNRRVDFFVVERTE